MVGYFPLDRGLLNSTLWITGDSDTRSIWVFLLLAADIKTGIVTHSVPAIANANPGVSIEKVKEILEMFASPDPNSRSPENEGRRIKYVDSENPNGGIIILNYLKKKEELFGSSTARNARRDYKYEEETGQKRKHRATEGDGGRRRATKEKEKEKEKELTNSSESEDIRQVFDYHVSIFNTGRGPKAKLTDDRRRKIRARLKEGFTVDQLKDAILGCSKSNFHVSGGYTGLVTILKSAESVERHIERLSGVGGNKPTGPAQPMEPDEWTEEDLKDDSAELGI